MRRCLLLLAMTLTISAFAQPELVPPFQPPPQPPRQPQFHLNRLLGAGMNALDNLNPVNLTVLPEGVFVLRNGVLAKFAAGTLEPAGVLELFGPLPQNPMLKGGLVTPDDINDWTLQNAARMARTAVLEKDDRLYIVIGSNYFGVNAKTMQLDVKADLSEPNNNIRLALMDSAPQIKLEGGMLFIVTGQTLLIVEPETGKVAARAALPRELFPVMPGLAAGLMPPGAAPFAEGRNNRGAAGRRNEQ